MYTTSIDVGTKNLAYVIISDDFQIIEWDVVTIPQTSTKSVIKCLREMFIEKDITTVLIEKQPSRNVKMRVFENTLGVFFEMSGFPRVLHYSAKYKLGDIGKTIKGRVNYNLRKKYSIQMCRQFLKENDDLASYSKLFESHKKKDDLSDCLLQFISYKSPAMINDLSKCIVTL